MIPLEYLTLRLVRRHLPSRLMRRLLHAGRIVKPGLETFAPRTAADQFCSALTAAGCKLMGARVLIFGYGGHFGVGVELLRRGAGHVVLMDPFAEPHREANLKLARENNAFLQVENGRVVPDPERITLVSVPVEIYAVEGGVPADLVLSNSVFEHVKDPDRTIAALARITRPEGHHLHIIDLRDHFFRYPFEMLCYSELVWKRFLNPPSHLNRLRIRDYERRFRDYFEKVHWEAIEAELEAFRQTRHRIRPEFLTGDESLDAITRIALHGRQPCA